MLWLLAYGGVLSLAQWALSLCLANLQVDGEAFVAVDQYLASIYKGRHLEVNHDGFCLGSNRRTILMWQGRLLMLMKSKSVDTFVNQTYTVWTASPHTLKSFFRECLKHHQVNRGVEVRMAAGGSRLDILPNCPLRGPESVIGQPTLEIIEDARSFLNAQEKYMKFGVPFRRGYLFQGPPGTGKSSSAVALASELGAILCYINAASSSCTDSWLTRSMADFPQKAVILFEDVDRLNLESSGVTLGGLLNALDGPVAQTGRILVMTANDPAKIPAVLRRPGRVDRVFDFVNLDQDSASEFYSKFHTDSAKFREAMQGRTISPAMLSSMLMHLDEDAIIESVLKLDPQGLSHNNFDVA